MSSNQLRAQFVLVICSLKNNMETSLIASKKPIDKSIKSLQYITDISFPNGVKQKWTVLYNNYG